MSTRDEYVEKLKIKLDQWNAGVDELKARANQETVQMNQSFQELDAQLKQKGDQAQAKLNELRQSSGDAWRVLNPERTRCGTILSTVSKKPGSRFQIPI